MFHQIVSFKMFDKLLEIAPQFWTFVIAFEKIFCLKNVLDWNSLQWFAIFLMSLYLIAHPCLLFIFLWTKPNCFAENYVIVYYVKYNVSQSKAIVKLNFALKAQKFQFCICTQHIKELLFRLTIMLNRTQFLHKAIFILW